MYKLFKMNLLQILPCNLQLQHVLIESTWNLLTHGQSLPYIAHTQNIQVSQESDRILTASTIAQGKRTDTGYNVPESTTEY